MIGRRQDLQAQSISLAAAAVGRLDFQVDNGTVLVRRLKIFIEGTATTLQVEDSLIMIEAEGELLYSGRHNYIKGLCPPTDQANANNAQGPHVLTFDRPLSMSKVHPVRVTITNQTTATNTFVVVLEGAWAGEAA